MFANPMMDMPINNTTCIYMLTYMGNVDVKLFWSILERRKANLLFPVVMCVRVHKRHAITPVKSSLLFNR